MKCVSVTRTGNECDIIEAFVRHHAALFDEMIVIDDRSTDGTARILQKLKEEGLPIILLHAADVAWDELDFGSPMMHMAFGRGATWVAPLDVDEFIELPEGRSLADVLPEPGKVLIQLRWHNFVWQRHLAGKTENPVTQMTLRLPPRADSYKAIIPRTVVENDPDARLRHGNHGLSVHGRYVDLIYLKQIALCHYPIRSIDQFASKSVITYLRYVAIPDIPEAVGVQYRKTIELIKQGSGGIMAEMERSSHLYGLADGTMSEGNPVLRPLRYLGGPLLYPERATTAMANIVNHGETMAREIARLKAANNAG